MTAPHLNLDDEPEEPNQGLPPNIKPFVPHNTDGTPIGLGADFEPAVLPATRAPSRPNHQRVAAKPPADPAPPPLHDRAAEAHVLSCVLLDSALATVPAQAFHFPEHRLLYLSVQRLLASKAPIELATIAADLSDHQQFTTIGGWPFLFQTEQRDAIPTTLHFWHYADRIADLARRRQAKAHAEATLKALALGERPPLPPGSLDDMFAEPASQAKAATRVRRATPPKEPQTRLFLAGKPICTPGNLTTIISRAKTGKTAALGAAVAAIIAAHNDRHDLDTLGFTAPHTDEAVILIDTEQSPYDAWVCHDRAIKRADSDDPEWLHHHAMVGFTPKQLRDGLTAVIAEAKAAHKGIFTIILDGVADFVSSVNDEAETKEFIAWLRTITVTHDCPCVCVIHSNEGVKTGDDGRGHLGKELTRKSESNLLLKKEAGITTITSEKQRKAPITEEDGISFAWSDTQQRHVLTERPVMTKGKSGKPKTYSFDTFTSIFPRTPDKAMTKAALMRFATSITPIKDAEFTEMLCAATDNGELIRTPKTGGFYYHLNVPSAPA